MNMTKVQHLCFIIHKFKTFLLGAKAVRQMEYASAFQAVWISAVMLWQTRGLVLWDQYAGELKGKIPTAVKGYVLQSLPWRFSEINRKKWTKNWVILDMSSDQFRSVPLEQIPQ